MLAGSTGTDRPPVRDTDVASMAVSELIQLMKAQNIIKDDDVLEEFKSIKLSFFLRVIIYQLWY